MTFVKIKDRPDLIKDTVTGAILTVDRKNADEYHRQKSFINNTKKMQQEMNEVREKLSEIDNVKQELQDIKNLLKELVSK